MSKNPYPGINPHLNSYLQNEGGWKSFHFKHINHLTEYIEVKLPSGYYTMPEDSLQITAHYPDAEVRSKTEPDISIYYTETGETVPIAGGNVATPTKTVPVIRTLVSEDEPYTAVIIYNKADTPVTRIELLSPSNKPTYSHHHNQYMQKRDNTLRAGLRLVEIDYLHQTPPLLTDIPSYRDKQPGSSPYALIVSDPRPTLETGLTHIYEFGVMDTLPIIDIPLDGKDTVRVDFGAVYNTTVSSSRAYSQIFSDPTKPPANMDAYAEADQHQINAHIQQIIGK